MADDESGIRKLEVPKMVQYVRTYNGDPDVVKLARRIVQLCSAKDRLCEMNALFLWVKNHVRYVADPLGKELIATPKFHMAEIMTPPDVVRKILGDKLIAQMNGFGLGGSLVGDDSRKTQLVCKGCFMGRANIQHGRTSGDCDEGSTFLATLLSAVGIKPRFRFGGQVDDTASDGCNYHHVWVQGKDDHGKWVDMDVTEKQSKLGWFFDGFTCTGIAEIFPSE